MRLLFKPLLVKFPCKRLIFSRSFIDNPYVFWPNRPLAHALGDVWAMNADPVSALATVVVPFGIESQVEETLFQLMSGACDVLRDAGCASARDIPAKVRNSRLVSRHWRSRKRHAFEENERRIGQSSHCDQTYWYWCPF